MTRYQIEELTAHKWAARAVAAYELSAQARARGDHQRARYLLTDASEYMHEAAEHAAIADDSGHLLRDVWQWVRQRIPQGAI